MLNQEACERFAQEWIQAWNSHSLEAILAHYSEDFSLTSPFIPESMGLASGTLRGKRQVGVYWAKALHKMPDLKFTLIDVACGLDSLVIHYHAVLGKKAMETFFFNPAGKVIRSVAHYS